MLRLVRTSKPTRFAVAAFACLVFAPGAAAASGDITTVAGTGAAGLGGDGGPAVAAQLSGPTGVYPTADGGYLIADYTNNRIRKVSAGGVISTVAGTGAAGFSGDGGAATAATLNAPVAIAVLSDGSFLIADSANNRIRKVSAGGIISTVAGTGAAGFSGDSGAATAALLDSPVSVAALSDGGFLIADSANGRIRKVSAGGVITTVAGTGIAAFGGDGGAATAAQLNAPVAVQPTPDGGFLVADMMNSRIRAVAGGGTITTVAGTGTAAFGGDGIAATASDLNAPVGVALGANGAILIADTSNNRIRSVDRTPVVATEPVVTVVPTTTESSTPAGPASAPGTPHSPTRSTPGKTLTQLVMPKGGVTVTASGAVPLAIGCPADAGGRCEGTVTLQVSVRSARASSARRGRAKAVTIASAKYSVAAGGTTTVKAQLSRRGRQLLASSKGGMKVTAKITRRGGPTLDQKPQTAAIKLKPPKPRRANRASVR